MKPSIPSPTVPRAFRREGGLLLMRRVINPSRNLEWYRESLGLLPTLPQLAAGTMTERGQPALVLVWCQAGHAHLITRALTPLDPRLGKAPVISWPATFDLTGTWETWYGQPHFVAAGPLPDRFTAAEVARW